MRRVVKGSVMIMTTERMVKTSAIERPPSEFAKKNAPARTTTGVSPSAK
jgi:hypothetical protein